MTASPAPLADVVTDSLSSVARALEVPVHVVAILLLLLLALEAGRFATEAWRRGRPGRSRLLGVACQALTDPARADAIAPQASSGLAERAVRDMAGARASGREEAVEYALADYELGVQRRLDRTRMLVRAGPAVGLMGTLIPLAPGLGALGRGDFASLADDLQVAFAATVIGILVGTGAFTLTLLRTRFYTEDLAALERAVGATPPTAAAGPASDAPGAPSGPGAPVPSAGDATPHHARVTESIGEHTA
ncbi:MotA/TolQ/ExbB proton channel family protein [Patulibacter sp. NPDC049589]|uniref:MotA/TolQ/ExbB proton channel family protein n=1 Tax=Patulibacter sp. NPDC049589 TaxID=3154731 RepID=UPI0034342C63